MPLRESGGETGSGYRDAAGVYVAFGNTSADIGGLVTNADATADIQQRTGRVNLDSWSGGAYWTHYGPQAAMWTRWSRAPATAARRARRSQALNEDGFLGWIFAHLISLGNLLGLFALYLARKAN